MICVVMRVRDVFFLMIPGPTRFNPLPLPTLLRVTQRPSRLAVVSIGYADGVSRCLSGRIHALHAGHIA